MKCVFTGGWLGHGLFEPRGLGRPSSSSSATVVCKIGPASSDTFSKLIGVRLQFSIEGSMIIR